MEGCNNSITLKRKTFFFLSAGAKQKNILLPFIKTGTNNISKVNLAGIKIERRKEKWQKEFYFQLMHRTVL